MKFIAVGQVQCAIEADNIDEAIARAQEAFYIPGGKAQLVHTLVEKYPESEEPPLPFKDQWNKDWSKHPFSGAATDVARGIKS